MTILVTGATGAVGRHLVTTLLARGVAVRALTRKPDGARLPAGVEFVGAATAHGVHRFTVLSSLAAAKEFPRDLGSVSQLHHAAVEAAVTGRSDAWTILRPGTFANNLLAWAWQIRSGAPIRAPYLAS